MNIEEIKNAVKFACKETFCPKCGAKYIQKNIHVLASTKSEVLLETDCKKCKQKSVITITNTNRKSEENFIKQQLSTPSEKAISQNDVLDTKLFLNKFTGSFKELFNKKQ